MHLFAQYDALRKKWYYTERQGVVSSTNVIKIWDDKYEVVVHCADREHGQRKAQRLIIRACSIFDRREDERR